MPTPEEKREGGNVYEELAQIVLCDVTVIYVTYVNKLYFLSRRESPRATRIPRQNACQRLVSRLLTLAITKSKESLRLSVDKRIAFSK